MRNAVVAVFFVQGFLFASWTAHIPHLKDHLHLGDGSLGIALFGAPLGSMLAMLAASRLLTKFGSRRVVRVALVGYCLAGPLVGLSYLTHFVLRRLSAVGHLSRVSRRFDERASHCGRRTGGPTTHARVSWVVEHGIVGRRRGGGAGGRSRLVAFRATPHFRGALSDRCGVAVDSDDPQRSSSASRVRQDRWSSVAGVFCRRRLSCWPPLPSRTCSVRARWRTGRRCTCTEPSTRRPS